MSGTLRFELATPVEGEPIPFDTFALLAENLSGLLDELDRTRSGGRSVRWLVTGLEIGSALVQVTSEPLAGQLADSGPQIVRDAVETLAAARSGRRPPHVQPRAWEYVDGIATILREQDVRIEIAAEDEPPIQLGPDLALALPEVLVALPEPEVAIGSVEGALETVYLHDEPHFDVWDVLYGRRIRCDFSRSLLDKVRAGLGERVRVHGRIAFGRDGRPEAMPEVVDLQVLRDRPRPRPADLRGLVPGMTGGLGAARWIRQIRDAEAQ
jgi:hypothetical protein